jgi:hypothetical protein
MMITETPFFNATTSNKLSQSKATQKGYRNFKKGRIGAKILIESQIYKES